PVTQRFFGRPLWISFAAHLLVFVGLLLYVQFGPDPGEIRTTGLQDVQFVDLVDPSAVVPDESAPAMEAAPEASPVEPVAETAPPTGPAVGAPAQPASGPLPLVTAEGGETE